MKRIFYFLTLLICVACADDDSFSTSTGLKLDFSVDTLRLDTVFSRTPSSTYSFWVHNRNNDGLRLQSVRLKRGNQTGYRVNVDGIYLDNANGSQTQNLEIRKKDSILVFVELTASETFREEPMAVEDDLLFTLESGVEQKVLLQAWAWDAVKLYSPVIATDSVIDTRVPYIIYGAGYWGTDDEVKQMAGFFDKDDARCRNAAYTVMGWRKCLSEEKTMMDRYWVENENSRSLIVRDVFEMHSGRAVDFYMEAYNKTASNDTKLQILYALKYYNKESAKVFNELQSKALPEQSILFKHVQNPLIVKQLTEKANERVLV